jgi:hypothetical protein
MSLLVQQHLCAETALGPNGPRSRYIQALEHATDEDLRAMLQYTGHAQGNDRKAFYLSCETLARTGALRVLGPKGSEPQQLRVENAQEVQRAWAMFFSDAKTAYCSEKRLSDLHWMVLLATSPTEALPTIKARLLLQGSPLVCRRRKIYRGHALCCSEECAVAVLMSTNALQQGTVLVRMSKTVRRRYASRKPTPTQRSLLLSDKYIRRLTARTEQFWAERLESVAGQSADGRTKMEQYFHTRLHDMCAQDIIADATDDGFRIVDSERWWRATRVFGGSKLRDCVIAWVCMLGWVSTEHTVPGPSRAACRVPCATFKRLTAAERQDAALFNEILERSRVVMKAQRKKHVV